ncbi:hypothetical protein JW916_11575 [Candidatus Sumerlaeota bacterium]|nr:hypothetical protein [Candidatus Sumerlaeota bacterium]
MPFKGSRYGYLGEAVCEICAERAGRCANCGDVLLGTYYPAKDDPSIRGFCKKCMEEKPKCEACGRPYPDLREVEGHLLCARCLKKAERCDACGALIVGKYYKIEFLEGKFCETCIARKDRCDFCGRPLAGDGAILPDGRRTCGPCTRSAVGDMDQAKDLLERTIRYLASRHGLSVRTPFDLALADGASIALVSGHTEAPASSRSFDRDETRLRELGVFATRPLPDSPRPVILILDHLPVTAFLETAAHEYAHLWEFENGVDLTDQVLAEGFAQWVASKWLLKNRLNAAHARLAKRTDPVYGAGYRRIAEYERLNGTMGTIAWVLGKGRSSRRTNPLATPDFSRAVPLSPLSECLSRESLRGEYAFFASAVVIQPSALAGAHAPSSERPQRVSSWVGQGPESLALEGERVRPAR